MQLYTGRVYADPMLTIPCLCDPSCRATYENAEPLHLQERKGRVLQGALGAVSGPHTSKAFSASFFSVLAFALFFCYAQPPLQGHRAYLQPARQHVVFGHTGPQAARFKSEARPDDICQLSTGLQSCQ